GCASRPGFGARPRPPLRQLRHILRGTIDVPRRGITRNGGGTMKKPQAPIHLVNGKTGATGDFVYGKYRGSGSGRATLTARVAEAPPAPTYTSARIARIRDSLHLSQAVFAMALNVSPETVRAWEQ